MHNNNLYKFFFSIVLPSMLAILLFVITFFVMIIPQFEKNLMDARKETIKELTQSAWSIIKEYHDSYTDSVLTLDEAQRKAAHQIEKMRYGQAAKDYFWIVDSEPRMVMHPYRKELMNTDLSDYEDSHGKKLFVEAVKVVNENQEGFVDYYWQWKDDTTRIVPKLSYVKGFEPWEWVIGTGIYLEDVRQEIAHLKNRLLFISLGIVLLIVLIWIYVIRQSLKLEYKRRSAEKNLRSSRQKYKTHVEASSDGTLMLVDDQIIYHNLRFRKLIEKADGDKLKLSFNELFNLEWEQLKPTVQEPYKSVNVEARLIVSPKAAKDVVLTISKVDYASAEGYIVIVKDVTTEKQISKETHELEHELQLPMLNMSKPITNHVKSFLEISFESSVKDAAVQMKRYGTNIMFVSGGIQIVGVITERDLQNRIIAEGKDLSTPVSEIMSAPVISIEHSAPVYKAVIKIWQHNISHLLVKNDNGKPIGVVGKTQLLDFQQNSLGYIAKEIYNAETVEVLTQLYKRLPVLANALLESGSKASNITYITSFVADAIHERTIELAIEDLGEPPVAFCFMVLGSEGRMEETLYTDQDNAIVFEDDDSAKDYFDTLAEKITDDLHRIGYNRCQGDIMASNTKWCQPLSVWKKYFTEWVQSPDPQNILDSSIFFDFRCAYGSAQLTETLRHHLKTLTTRNGLFFYHMSQSLNRFKPALDSETVDLKKIIFPLVSVVRVYSLNYQVNAINTVARLTQLATRLERVDTKELLYIYDFLTNKRLEIQINAIMNHKPPDNMLDTNTLTLAEYKLLEHAVSKINEFLSGLQMEFAK
jgi:signal-transduction protein with cAMP-binding, CBS, and nucleotidyltransferase domain/PAS domain-containing protein